MPNVYTPELIKKLKELTQGMPRPDGVKALAKHLNLSIRAARSAFARYVEGTGNIGETDAASVPAAETETPPKSQGAHMKIEGDFAEMDLVTDNPRSLEDLIKACRVDLNVWEVERFVVNKWEMGRKAKTVNMSWVNGVASGSVEDTGGITKAPLWQVKAWLRRKVEASTINQMLEKFTVKAAEHAPKTFTYVKAKPAKADCCYVLNGQDLHLAKLAWNPETNHGDWDIKIAREKDDAAVEDLMQKVPVERIEEIVIIVGSDMLQVDNDKSSTTAGTYVDSDSRLAKAFEVAADMLTTRIETLASRFKIKVIVIPGNHDSTVSLFLGKYVQAWFRNHPNVDVDARPCSRKYYGYGNMLIGFDHGDETKIKDLPLIIMRENQSTISQYKYIECLTGHLHAEQAEDTKGIMVRVAPALCAPDKWHARKGYIGTIRRSQGLLYHRENGLYAIYYSNPLD